MKAIQTKCLPCTNYNGSRIKAWEPDGKSVTLPWDHALDGEGNAREAAEALSKKIKRTGKMVSGWTSTGYVFVFVN
jgi:hypothetical protein